MVLQRLDRYRNGGLLLLRIGLGLTFIFIHGWPKLIGGPEKWAAVGASMEVFGLGFAPVFWGFMAAFTEVLGGALLILGFFFRPACMLLFIVMVVATVKSLGAEMSWGPASHALKMAVVFLSLIFIGPGKKSLDERFRPGRHFGFKDD